MQINFSILVLSFLIGLRVCNSTRSYKNYTLFRAIPKNDDDLIFLSNLASRYDMNYWRESNAIRMPVEFVIAPHHRLEFLNKAQENRIQVETLIEDVQKAFDKQRVQKKYVRRKMSSMNWNSYFRLEDIYNWLSDLSMAYPREVQLIVIGTTHENRKILAVKIALQQCKNRSTVFIEGGIHAREWISPSVVTYLINTIAHAKTSSNDILKEIALTYEWYFVPVLNPDGYEYSHTNDRLWRKNRNGLGVDINRNFDVGFGTHGSSSFVTSEIYCGPRPFSEKESSAIAKLIRKVDKIEYYLSFHSYGQHLILPYGHLMGHHENYNEVYAICQEAARSIAVKYKTKYTIGTAFETVGYMASGISSCWVKKDLRVPYVLTLELRDEGAEGFALSPNKILPTCRETLDGIITMLIPKKENYTRLAPSNLRSGESYNILDKAVMVFYAFFVYYNNI